MLRHRVTRCYDGHIILLAKESNHRHVVLVLLQSLSSPVHHPQNASLRKAVAVFLLLRIPCRHRVYAESSLQQSQAPCLSRHLSLP